MTGTKHFGGVSSPAEVRSTRTKAATSSNVCESTAARPWEECMVNSRLSTMVMSAITGACVALAVSAYTGGRAETPLLAQAARPAQQNTLTAMDYVQIHNLVASYARGNDTCGNNGYMYADLFTADGSFNSSRNGKLGTPAVGREALAEAAGGGSKKCAKLDRPEGLWIHAIVNLIIEPSADGGATGTSDLVYPSLKGKDFDANHAGHVGGYRYVFAKTPQGWRFKSVVHELEPWAKVGNTRG